MEDPLHFCSSVINGQRSTSFMPDSRCGYSKGHSSMRPGFFGRSNLKVTGLWPTSEQSLYQSKDQLFKFTNTKNEAIEISSDETEDGSSEDEVTKVPKENVKRTKTPPQSQLSQATVPLLTPDLSQESVTNSPSQPTNYSASKNNATTPIKRFKLNGIERRVSYSLPLPPTSKPSSTIDLTLTDDYDEEYYDLFNDYEPSKFEVSISPQRLLPEDYSPRMQVSILPRERNVDQLTREAAQANETISNCDAKGHKNNKNLFSSYVQSAPISEQNGRKRVASGFGIGNDNNVASKKVKIQSEETQLLLTDAPSHSPPGSTKKYKPISPKMNKARHISSYFITESETETEVEVLQNEKASDRTLEHVTSRKAMSNNSMSRKVACVQDYGLIKKLTDEHILTNEEYSKAPIANPTIFETSNRSLLVPFRKDENIKSKDKWGRSKLLDGRDEDKGWHSMRQQYRRKKPPSSMKFDLEPSLFVQSDESPEPEGFFATERHTKQVADSTFNSIGKKDIQNAEANLGENDQTTPVSTNDTQATLKACQLTLNAQSEIKVPMEIPQITKSNNGADQVAFKSHAIDSVKEKMQSKVIQNVGGQQVKKQLEASVEFSSTHILNEKPILTRSNVLSRLEREPHEDRPCTLKGANPIPSSPVTGASTLHSKEPHNRVTEDIPLTAAAAIKARKQLQRGQYLQTLPRWQKLLLELRDQLVPYKEIRTEISQATNEPALSLDVLQKTYKKIKISLGEEFRVTRQKHSRNQESGQHNRKHSSSIFTGNQPKEKGKAIERNIDRPQFGGKTISQENVDAYIASLNPLLDRGEDDSSAVEEASSRSPSPFIPADATHWVYQLRRKTWGTDEDETEIDWVVVGQSDGYTSLEEANKAATAELGVPRNDFLLNPHVNEVDIRYTSDHLAKVLARSPNAATCIEVYRFIKSTRAPTEKETERIVSKYQWAPRRVYDIRRTTTTTMFGPDPGDPLFDEIVVSRTTKTEDVDKAVYTVADMANRVASRHFVELQFRKGSQRIDDVYGGEKEQNRMKALCDELEEIFDSSTKYDEYSSDADEPEGLFSETWTAPTRQVKINGSDKDGRRREERTVRIFVTRRWLKGPRNI